MIEATLAAAFVLGFAGSGHCVAMCGGIAGALGLATPESARRTGRPLWHAAAYNGGRVTSYATAGLVAGVLGAAITQVPGAELVRVALVVLAGVLMAAMGAKLAAGGRALRWLDDLGVRFWRLLQPLTRHLFPIRTTGRAFLAGMLWGWLPCGMVYGALALAASSSGPLEGAATMAAFGLGTVPALVAVSVFGPTLRAARFATARRVAGVVLVAIGITSIAFAVMPTADHAGHAGHAAHAGHATDVEPAAAPAEDPHHHHH